MNTLRIILAGGSGFLGGALAAHFQKIGYEAVILTRTPRNVMGQASSLPVSEHMTNTGKMPVPLGCVREVAWDARTLGDWARELDGAVAVVNLTGRSVDCRYNAKNRKEILESRVFSTRVVGEAIAQCKAPPGVWLNSSTATLYKHTFDHDQDDYSTEMDSVVEAKDAFSVEVAQAWEAALFQEFSQSRLTSAATKTRKVALRTSMVLGLGHNSVFPVLRRLTRFGLGGRQGSGKQFVSWIHETDFCRAVEWIITHENFEGPVNVCAPNPLPNLEMMRAFREVCKMPVGLPATEWMLEIGAFFMRTETELMLKSRRVVPRRLLESGFEFRFPFFRDALEDLQTQVS